MFSAALLLFLVQTPEATSLGGQPLFSPPASAAAEANLAQARAGLEKEPNSADALIWVGRRLGYVGRYQEAIATFSQGVTRFPQDARFLRHRGHRYLTIRKFDLAIADFERATRLVKGQPDQIEPDGLPNRVNQPRSSLQFNIWYHLGLAHYLKGDFAKALRAYRECMKVSRSNDDSLTATTDWLYMTYRRLNRPREAAAALVPIREKMDIIENDSYHRRLLMYKGLRPPESLLDPAGADDLSLATQGYGVGNWYLYHGQKEKALEIFRKVTAGRQWSAFGFIAAEADLQRLR
ncbi:MAG: tetratricopeptide repeat protein [Bryobacteraceae bacterium]|nr:tetratricopeptide repeat protein [Bryobacteraceae bacterium]